MKCNVTKEQCLEAIEYLFVEGFVDEMTSDKKYYTTILLKKVANIYKIKLYDEDSTMHPLGTLEEVNKWKVV